MTATPMRPAAPNGTPPPAARPDAAAAARAGLPPLIELWQLWLNTPAARSPLPASIRTMLHAASPAEIEGLLEWVAQNAQDRNRLRQVIAELTAANVTLEQRLLAMLRPPHHVARLLAFDAASRLAWIAPTPNSRTEVRLHDDLDATTLAAGADVVLATEGNCVLRVLPRGTTTGGGRILTFRRFLDDLPHGELKPLLAADAANEQLVWVAAEMAGRLRTLAAAGRQQVRLCVDEHGLTFALACDDGADPRAAAARFRMALEPVAPAGLIGLQPQRQRVEDAVLRSRSRGAFVLCEGPTGCGKTHLARYALHLLRQHGEALVLGLRSSADHRYYGQEENDVESMFAAARAIAAAGTPVLVFADEIDKQFFQSRSHDSMHVNSTRATWLAQLGDGAELPGLLVFATTNKAGHLPDELLNRVTHPVSFRGIDRAQARGLLDHYLTAVPIAGADRARLLDAIVEVTHGGAPHSLVAVVTLRDQSRVPVLPHHLRQVSARFCRELAVRLHEHAAAAGSLPVERALALTHARLREVVQGLGLSAANVADRCFLEFAPRNPPEHVEPAPWATSVENVLFRYQPLDLEDDRANAN